MRDSTMNGTDQRHTDAKAKETAQRGQDLGKEWILRSAEPAEAGWFLEARDFKANSTDAWQVDWECMVWCNAVEVAEEFTKIIQKEGLDADTFWEHFAEGVWVSHGEVEAA